MEPHIYAHDFCVPSAAVLICERLVKPFVYLAEPDECRVGEVLENDYPALLDCPEQQLLEAGYIFTDFGTVDIALASVLI